MRLRRWRRLRRYREALLARADTARSELAAANVAAREKQTRDQSERALRVAIWLICTLLNWKIGPSDSRWLLFGLNIPKPKTATPTAPALTAQPTTGKVLPLPPPEPLTVAESFLAAVA